MNASSRVRRSPLRTVQEAAADVQARRRDVEQFGDVDAVHDGEAVLDPHEDVHDGVHEVHEVPADEPAQQETAW